MAFTWLKGLSIVGLLGGISSVIGIATADYSFSVADASVGFAIMPTEMQINKFMSDFWGSREFQDLVAECRAAERACDQASLQREILPNAEALPREYWSFITVVTNNSDKDVRALHVSFVARNSDGDIVWHDFLEPGQTIEAGQKITGSLPLNDQLASAHTVDVCVSHRGYFYLDVVRKEYTMDRSAYHDARMPGFEMVGFAQRGRVTEAPMFKGSHCPENLVEGA
ncbi:hypothetical protein G0P98_20025 [Yangia sp. PrR004]|nr:hypothetical protein [Salipiger sp. PrR004]